MTTAAISGSTTSSGSQMGFCDARLFCVLHGRETHALRAGALGQCRGTNCLLTLCAHVGTVVVIAVSSAV